MDHGGPRLDGGGTLRLQSLTSSGGEFTLNHFGWEDLVLFRNSDRTPLWWTGPRAPDDWRSGQRHDTPASAAALRPGGELVLLDPDGSVLWSSGTADTGANVLEVRDDGDVVLLDGDERVVWRTGTAAAAPTDPPPPVARGDRILVGQSLADQSLTSANGRYVLVHGSRTGGTFVYGPDGKVVFFYLVPSFCPYPYDSRLWLEEDGLFLHFPDGVRKAWDSLTTPRFPFHPKQVVLRDNGDLEMLDEHGTVMWRNGVKHDDTPTKAEPGGG
jgi:hypothetical protein